MKHSVIFVLAAVACTEPEPTLEAVYAAPEQCGPNGCGDNSPVIHGVYFGELNELPGIANGDGVSITSVMSANAEPMLLQVDGDRLIGVDADDPTTQLAAGPGLVDTRIYLDVNGHEYVIRISAWHAAPNLFWVGAGSPTTEYYDFVYSPLANQHVEKELCSEALNGPDMIHAFVFTGDRYDPTTKVITEGLPALHWFNIACFGSATAKLYLTGHANASADKLGLDPKPTVKQRRAMLNAWTSNVCGTGQAFTYQGEPLVMRDSMDLIRHAHPSSWEDLNPPATYEAIWDASGAVCLNDHRLEDEDLEEGEHFDPLIRRRIRQYCSLPRPCSALDLATWKSRGHVLTGNP
jgi:hypothetical protein